MYSNNVLIMILYTDSVQGLPNDVGAQSGPQWSGVVWKIVEL